ncbi:hypothetical protein BpHYR1_052173 [Brachionus plicatilis]|uniref:Uncharacterized protein n=1 Tax=Brachionus plicatilis TaxID=10195 RepID=A0A3M7QKS9_BRAPC|nr:hypothetical protein BpHYR1_052173 [Brachionus plicatilis]
MSSKVTRPIVSVRKSCSTASSSCSIWRRFCKDIDRIASLLLPLNEAIIYLGFSSAFFLIGKREMFIRYHI